MTAMLIMAMGTAALVWTGSVSIRDRRGAWSLTDIAVARLHGLDLAISGGFFLVQTRTKSTPGLCPGWMDAQI